MASRLTKLRVEEISGVDDPANELPGWLVMKSRDALEQVEAFEKSIGELHDKLVGPDADLYFADANEEVRKAREELVAHLANDVEEADEEPTRKGAGDRFKELFKAGAYDDSDFPEPGEGSDAESSAPRVEELPGDPEGGEPAGAGQDKQDKLDLSEGTQGTTNDKYGNVVDEKTGEPIDADEKPDPEPSDDGEDSAEDESETSDENDGPEVEFASPEAESAASELSDGTDLKPGGGSGEDGKYTVKDVRKLVPDDEDEDDVEKMVKSVAGVIEAELEPLKEAVIAIADRTENLEKAAAASQGITLDELDPSVPDAQGEVGIAKALGVALREGKVTLT